MMSMERLRYVDRIPAAKGTYYYFRRNGQRERLPGSPADPDFMAAYERLSAPSWPSGLCGEC